MNWLVWTVDLLASISTALWTLAHSVALLGLTNLQTEIRGLALSKLCDLGDVALPHLLLIAECVVNENDSALRAHALFTLSFLTEIDREVAIPHIETISSLLGGEDVSIQLQCEVLMWFGGIFVSVGEHRAAPALVARIADCVRDDQTMRVRHAAIYGNPE